jgi:DNA-directed RNA polymerase specialized sigma24 family protein
LNGVLVAASQLDPSLLPFLTADDALEEEAALARLNAEEIEPIITRQIGYKFRLYSPQTARDSQRPEFDEIYNDIQLRLLRRLHALKQDPAQNQIVNLRGYVATVARNTCDEYLRNRYPLRRSLKDKVRRHLLSHTEFALWEDTEHNWLAGLSGWRNDELRTTAGELRERLKMQLHSIDIQQMQLHDLLVTIVDVAHAPLDLDELTQIVAECWAIEDHPADPLTANTCAPIEETLTGDTNPATMIERREWLQLIWREIRQLPRRQRVALLLNLRNPHGINIITLLPATGIATFEQIAQTLEIPTTEFEQLWADLPLDDLHIAAYLGATRQQVINLRKTARERLLKRMNVLREQRRD